VDPGARHRCRLRSHWRYHKIEAQPEQIEALLIKRGVKAIPRKSTQIVLDFDATDDPLHGSQEGAYFNGYYREYCYLPLYCFCGKRDASDGTLEALQKIVPAIRRRFGKKVRIIVRADSAFARAPIMSWCEDNEVFYCFGLARNDRFSEEGGLGSNGTEKAVKEKPLVAELFGSGALFSRDDSSVV
jgi:hypothetical protein